MVFRVLALHLMSVGPRESEPTVKEIRMAYTRLMDGRRNWLRTALCRDELSKDVSRSNKGAPRVASSPVTFQLLIPQFADSHAARHSNGEDAGHGEKGGPRRR
jgi:hypothetical protein